MGGIRVHYSQEDGTKYKLSKKGKKFVITIVPKNKKKETIKLEFKSYQEADKKFRELFKY